MNGPFTGDCTFCQMTGKVNGSTCRQCGGSRKVAVFVPSQRCPNCEGTGKLLVGHASCVLVMAQFRNGISRSNLSAPPNKSSECVKTLTKQSRININEL